MTDEINNLSGFILESSKDIIDLQHLSDHQKLKYLGFIGDLKWEQYDYFCASPLRHEDPPQIDQPYQYRIIVRRSGRRILLLSFNHRIVEHVLENVLRNNIQSPLNHLTISVDSLVKSLVSKPTDYVLSFAHARVPAFGVSLRSISYYGDDLGESSLFRECIPLTQFVTCGLRLVSGGTEVVRLSNDGMISFYYRDNQSIKNVERALRFLKNAGYLAVDILN